MFEFLRRNQETIPAIVHNLGFIKEENWINSLRKKTNLKESEKFRIKLVRAGKGIGDCMDERKAKKKSAQRDVSFDTITERNTENPKPSFVGGAAGFTFMFYLADPACTIEQAAQKTRTLYEQMRWGDMEIHIDDEHGHITDPARLLERNKGCGFLGASPNLLTILRDLDLTKRTIKEDKKSTFGQDMFNALRKEGAKTVILEGNHAPDAKIVINQIEGKTYPKDNQFTTQPAFCWDMWATANQEVYEKFLVAGSIDANKFTIQRFQRIQAAMHLATGMLLGVGYLGPRGNVVITSN
jgi:hypothetical protein